MRTRSIRGVLAGLATIALTTATVAATAPAAASEPEPTPLPPPPTCERGCEKVFDIYPAYNVRFVAWQDADVPTSRNVLVYYYDGRIHDVLKLDSKASAAASCGREGDAVRCAVTYFSGAHSMGAMAIQLTWNDGIVITDDVISGVPSAHLVALDGNGRADVVLRESTYVPSYAEAPQYWMTYLEFDGHFVLTGCTQPTQHATPVPDEPVYGPCDQP